MKTFLNFMSLVIKWFQFGGHLKIGVIGGFYSMTH